MLNLHSFENQHTYCPSNEPITKSYNVTEK